MSTTLGRYRPRDILIKLVGIRLRQSSRRSSRRSRCHRTGAAGDGRPAV